MSQAAMSIKSITIMSSVIMVWLGVSFQFFSMGKATLYELYMMSVSILALMIMMYMVSVLQKVSNDNDANQQRTAYMSEKLGHVEKRLMWLVVSGHEVRRLINSAFYEWNRDLDEQYFIRQVKQMTELWSAAQYRQSLPCGVQQWQYVFGCAYGEIHQEVNAMSAGAERDYFVEGMRIFDVQRANSPYTVNTVLSPAQLRQVYRTALAPTHMLMSSLDA